MSIWSDILGGLGLLTGTATPGEVADLGSAASSASSSIFGGIFGDISGGIEAGVVAVFADLWHAVEPFIEIAGAVVVFAIAIGLLFKNDLLALLPAAGAAAV